MTFGSSLLGTFALESPSFDFINLSIVIQPMSTVFDQKSQHVSGSQYNVAGNAEFAIQSLDFKNFGENLRQVKRGIDDLMADGKIESGDADIATRCIDQAIDAHGKSADSGRIKNYLDMASNVLQNVVAASGLVATIAQLVKSLGG